MQAHSKRLYLLLASWLVAAACRDHHCCHTHPTLFRAPFTDRPHRPSLQYPRVSAAHMQAAAAATAELAAQPTAAISSLSPSVPKNVADGKRGLDDDQSSDTSAQLPPAKRVHGVGQPSAGGSKVREWAALFTIHMNNVPCCLHAASTC